MEVENLTSAHPDIDKFLVSKPYVLVLLDAKWNNHKNLAKQFHVIASEYPGDDFAFAEVDVDDAEMAKRFEPMNVPAICYIFQGQRVKTVIGDSQNIKEQVRWFLDDCFYGYLD